MSHDKVNFKVKLTALMHLYILHLVPYLNPMVLIVLYHLNSYKMYYTLGPYLTAVCVPGRGDGE